MLLLGVAYPVVRFATGRALRPVDEMSRQAARWSVTEPDRRFGSSQEFRELDDLAANLDGLMDRVSGVLRHERSMSAELSHELRTPLTRILAEAELLAHNSSLSSDAHQAAAGIVDGATSMERIIATLLATSRADHGAVEGRCPIAALLDKAVEDLRAGRGERSPQVSVSVEDDLHAGIDAHVAERIIAPIIDNAVRYAREHVDLTATRAGQTVLIDIANDGPPSPRPIANGSSSPAIATGRATRTTEPGSDWRWRAAWLAPPTATCRSPSSIRRRSGSHCREGDQVCTSRGDRPSRVVGVRSSEIADDEHDD